MELAACAGVADGSGADATPRETSDALRLFKFFKITEGSGGVGGFITCLFYIAIFLFGLGILVFYGFAIYKNGAIMDAIWRLYVTCPSQNEML